MYTGGKWVLAAIEALGGRVEDRTRLLEALRAAQPAGLPRGLVTLDEYGSPIQSIYIARGACERRAAEHGDRHGAARVAVLEVRPADYLRQPLSRRFVPTS